MAPHCMQDDIEHAIAKQDAANGTFLSGLKSLKIHAVPKLITLTDLLLKAATTNAGLTYYAPGLAKETSISYRDLLESANKKANLLHGIKGLSQSSVVLIHFTSHIENIEWLWAVTVAGYLPAISTPFVNDLNQRKKHLTHLDDLLAHPVVLTTTDLVPEFLEGHSLNVVPVESLLPTSQLTKDKSAVEEKKGEDAGVLMLTSGSTGSCKAVPLTHAQIITSVIGKSAHHGNSSATPFLNWVGLDHVASLTEIHLHAMGNCANQVHVPATDLIQDPLRFLELIEKHKIEYTFAPNFFLSKLRELLDDTPGFEADLSFLKALISGGESNVVSTCAALTNHLMRLGVQGEVIRPGFGMTETCAGSIYSLDCPSADAARGLEYANLGTCVPGIKMRIMESAIIEAKKGETGDLQVSGPVVFKGYFNDATATKEAFTDDGWFITGDLAYIDDSGHLNLTGRSKDIIIVNGVKYSSTELETAIEEEMIPGVVPSYTAAFPHRPVGSATERICVLYHADFSEDPKERYETDTAISKIVSMITSQAPDHLIPLPKELLEKSSLGKISRTKVRAAFEKGDYTTFEDTHSHLLKEWRISQWRPASSPTEHLVLLTLSKLLEIPTEAINTRDSIFDYGISSFNLITLKRLLENALLEKIDIPLSALLNNPTIEDIASSIDHILSTPQIYNPIVPLQPHGTKTPLFCIHPGSGEIFIFIALAAQFTTRPIYALRTRGYNPNETLFPTLAETASTYVKHIREVQPNGPYAITGYSLGSILAFEVSKELEAQGHEVRFCGSIDYSPYVKHHVVDLNWVDVLLHISFFLGLINHDLMLDLTPSLRPLPHPEAIAHILSIGCPVRISELAMNGEKLTLITNIGENFRKGVAVYDPVGSVQSIDCFVADPPKYAAKDRKDWKENKLGRWREFSREEATFWDCLGVHAKMLDREYVVDFSKKLKAALRARGI